MQRLRARILRKCPSRFHLQALWARSPFQIVLDSASPSHSPFTAQVCVPERVDQVTFNLKRGSPAASAATRWAISTRSSVANHSATPAPKTLDDTVVCCRVPIVRHANVSKARFVTMRWPARSASDASQGSFATGSSRHRSRSPALSSHRRPISTARPRSRCLAAYGAEMRRPAQVVWARRANRATRVDAAESATTDSTCGPALVRRAGTSESSTLLTYCWSRLCLC